MLLIFSENTSPRLQYICKFIFEEMLGMTFSLTLHADSFSGHQGPKINYSTNRIDAAFHIKPHSLLFEKEIKPQAIECFDTGSRKAFFKTENADHPFDIFSAVFYLISRYEEYLPHAKDMYGRYAHENSLAYKEGFLNIPLVNIWLKDLGENLQTFFNTNNEQQLSFVIRHSLFAFLPTYDIDMAWSYREKGFIRNLAGFIRKPSLNRIGSVFGLNEDPFDCYRFLNDTHTLNSLSPLYFFLVAKSNGIYDKNILPDSEAMQQLIKSHSGKYEIGLHPSWKSNEIPELLKEEKNTLENIAQKKIDTARQHYIKFDLPETFQNLITAGITNDHSMGYGSINGFRASVASSFFWYNLKEEKITALRIHPFCFMDANCFYEERLSVEQSYEELMHYYFACKKINGTLITVFHNNFLGTDKAFAGWKELYIKFISQVR